MDGTAEDGRAGRQRPLDGGTTGNVMDGDPLTFLGRRLGPTFAIRVVTIAAGRCRLYDAAEWRDALVVVEQGEIHLECRAGRYRPFRQGDVLWLTGLPVRAMHNRGSEPVVLVAVSRNRSTTGTRPVG